MLVAQYSNSSSFDGVTSDPFEMLIPAARSNSSRLHGDDAGDRLPDNFINLVVPDSDVGTVAVDGTAGSARVASRRSGSTGFSGAQVDVSSASTT